MFLNTAYDRARQIQGFKTYQLDTQALSIYLLKEIKSSSPTVEGLEKILSSIKLITDMISEQSHRQYAIQVIDEIPMFIDVRRHTLENAEKVALVFELNRTSITLAHLPIEEKVYSGSELVRTRLEQAIAKLTEGHL